MQLIEMVGKKMVCVWVADDSKKKERAVALSCVRMVGHQEGHNEPMVH